MIGLDMDSREVLISLFKVDILSAGSWLWLFENQVQVYVHFLHPAV